MMAQTVKVPEHAAVAFFAWSDAVPLATAPRARACRKSTRPTGSALGRLGRGAAPLVESGIRAGRARLERLPVVLESPSLESLAVGAGPTSAHPPGGRGQGKGHPWRTHSTGP